MATIPFKATDEFILVVGESLGERGSGWMANTLYLRELLGREEGAPPPVDLAHERKVGDFVRGLIQQGRVTACHDVSDGGLMIALTEMAMASGIGFEITCDPGPRHAYLFGEDQGRYIVTVKENDVPTVTAAAEDAGVPVHVLGYTNGAHVIVNGETGPTVDELRAINERWLPELMAADMVEPGGAQAE